MGLRWRSGFIALPLPSWLVALALPAEKLKHLLARVTDLPANSGANYLPSIATVTNAVLVQSEHVRDFVFRPPKTVTKHRCIIAALPENLRNTRFHDWPEVFGSKSKFPFPLL